jgi:hypothetical protein
MICGFGNVCEGWFFGVRIKRKAADGKPLFSVTQISTNQSFLGLFDCTFGTLA